MLGSRLLAFRVSMKLLAATLFWPLARHPEWLPLGEERDPKAWKTPPWWPSRWPAGRGVSVEELRLLRELWLRDHPHDPLALEIQSQRAVQ